MTAGLIYLLAQSAYVGWPDSPSMDWFPQRYAFEFHITTASLALLGTLMLIFHMVKTWDHVRDWGQRTRYLVLFYLAVLVTGATVEIIGQQAPVYWRNIGACTGSVLLIFAMIFSIHHDFKRGRFTQ